MQLNISRRCPTLAALMTVALLAAVVVGQAEQEFKPSDDFDDDGFVEDVPEETLKTTVGEEMVYENPNFNPKQFHFVDHFNDIEESSKKWTKSQAKKDDTAEEIAKYDGVWKWEAPQRIVWKQDTGLVLKSKAKHAAIAARLDKAFTFKEKKPLVVQYEVTLQEGQECGGSYIKLLSAGKQTEDLTNFNDKTPYTIMFGPDKCGNDIKMHFIFRHVNPINGSITEKHCRKPKDRLEEPFKDKLPHLYQLVVHPDNTFEIRVDHKLINEGSLLSEFSPPVNPPREIDDPADVKPNDWDEREKIPDPTAQKPRDWDDDAPPQIPDPTATMPDDWLSDEPEMIPDPTALKPEDWDADIDGEWEAPLVDNPVCEKAVGCGQWKAPLITNHEYKGKWRAPLIDNPNYQGKWSPRKIDNPHFFEDLNPFRMTPIDAIGIELWSMSSDILFDNLIITDDVEVAKDFSAKTFDIKRIYIDMESKTLWHRLMRHMNYKPGWWALYFVYLLIPASCYVYYLYKRAKEDTFMKKVSTFADENPWVWKVVLVLLVAAVAYNLYRVATTKKDTAAVAKKTDEVQPDDNEDETLVGAGDATAAAQNTERSSPRPSASPKKKKKSDLDVKTVELEPEREKQTDSDADVDDSIEAEAEVDAAADGAETGTQTEESNAKTTRKRQVRKD